MTPCDTRIGSMHFSVFVVDPGCVGLTATSPWMMLRMVKPQKSPITILCGFTSTWLNQQKWNKYDSIIYIYIYIPYIPDSPYNFTAKWQAILWMAWIPPRKGRRASSSDLAANGEEVGHSPGNWGPTAGTVLGVVVGKAALPRTYHDWGWFIDVYRCL